MKTEILEETSAETGIVPINANAIEVFQKGGLNPILEAIRNVVAGFTPDVSTAKGRKEIASLAHKVAKSKVHIDEMGKGLVADWKERAKVVDAERKRMRDELDKLKEDVRKPLTEWETAEKQRVESHQKRLQELRELATIPVALPGDVKLSDALSRQLEAAKASNLSEIVWEEFTPEAIKAQHAVIESLTAEIMKQVKHEAELAELERLRKEAEERRKRDEEERLRKEGEERARREAEAKAKAEQQAREEAEAKREAEHKAALARAEQEKADAERRAKEAIEKAKRDAEEQARKEREKEEAARRAEADARAKREADEQHRATVTNQAVQSLMECVEISEKDARNVIRSISNREIKHVTINF